MNELAQRRSERLPPLAWCVAALPLFDCVVDQVNNTFHPGVGSLSLLQMINGPLMLVFAAGLVWAFSSQKASLRSVPIAVIGAFLMLAVASTAELVRTQSLSKDSIAPYGQMVYWVLLWSLVAVLSRQRGSADLILKGLALGALGTALSVFLGLIGCPSTICVLVPSQDRNVSFDHAGGRGCRRAAETGLHLLYDGVHAGGGAMRRA